MLKYREELAKEKPLIVDFHQQGASRVLFPNSPLLSSDESQWNHIHFEHHHQPSHDTPEHYTTMHAISLTLSSTLSERWFNGSRKSEYQTEGSMVIIPAGTLHRSLWEQEVQFMFVAIDHQLLEQLGTEIGSSKDIELIPHYATLRDPLLQGIILSVKDELQLGGAGGLYIEQLTTTLAVHLLKKYCVNKNKHNISAHDDGLPKYKLRQALDYINNHLDQDIKLTNLAQAVGMSQYYFTRLFKQSMGMAPYQYVIQQRVEKAKLLLKCWQVAISDIALACGFANQSHFTKYFRQLTGVTPKVYRENHSNFH
jgi:AraC family transcriptional regulator